MSEAVPLKISLVDEDGSTSVEDLLVQRLDDGMFLAEESAIDGEFRWRDIVEMEHLKDNEYRFVRVVRKSGFQFNNFIVAKTVIESEGMKLLLDHIMDLGGNWEIVFDSWLLTHVPADCDFDVANAIDLICAEVRSQK